MNDITKNTEVEASKIDKIKRNFAHFFKGEIDNDEAEYMAHALILILKESLPDEEEMRKEIAAWRHISARLIDTLEKASIYPSNSLEVVSALVSILRDALADVVGCSKDL